MAGPQSRLLKSRRVRAATYLGVAGLLVVVGWRPVNTHLDAAAFLLRFEGTAAAEEGLASLGSHEIHVREFPWDAGPAKLYMPVDEEDPPGVVLLHGVHAKGVEEARLQIFARSMASTGIAVLTPQVPELTEYRIEAQTVPRIGQAARALAQHLEDERVGVAGISFSGGLAILAAAEEAGAGRIGWVLSVGGHHDLSRVARFYVGQEVEGPAGEPLDTEPHPYGAGVLIYAHADELFPPEDVSLARDILRQLLHERWREARGRVGELSPSGQRQMRAVIERDDDARLGAELLAVLGRHEHTLGGASPAGHLATLDVPVFLIHGASDPVVPATETLWLASEIPEEHVAAVLITDALRHAEYEREPNWTERWDLVHFMAQVLAAARALE